MMQISEHVKPDMLNEFNFLANLVIPARNEASSSVFESCIFIFSKCNQKKFEFF